MQMIYISLVGFLSLVYHVFSHPFARIKHHQNIISESYKVKNIGDEAKDRLRAHLDHLLYPFFQWRYADSDLSSCNRLFNLCHENCDSLYFCAQQNNEIIDSCLLYGSIKYVWEMDIIDHFSNYISNERLKCSLNLSDSPNQMIRSFYSQTWMSLKKTAQLYTDINMILPSASMTERYPFHWWECYDDLIYNLDYLLQQYIDWSDDIEEWEDYIYKLDITPLASSTSLTEHRTQSLIQMTSFSSYFAFSKNMRYTPYLKYIPLMLETASPAKAIKGFCTEFSCTVHLINLFHFTNYVTCPELMTELTYFLTEERRYADFSMDDAKTIGELQKRDRYRYSTSLTSVCMKDENSKIVCDICAYYNQKLIFYLSQSYTIQKYHQFFPFLWEMEIPEFFAFVEFNDYLRNLYSDLRVYFQLPDDYYLEYWRVSDWGSLNIYDFYMIFQGSNDIWKAKPPVFYSMLSKYQISFEQYSLQYFWKRFLDIIATQRNIWWKELYEIAVKYDLWLNTLHLHGHLVEKCKNNKKMIYCIQQIQLAIFDIQRLSGGSIILPMSLQSRLAISTVRTSGNVELIKQAIELITTKKFKLFGKKNKPSVEIPLQNLPVVPSKAAILRCNYPEYQQSDASTTTTSIKSQPQPQSHFHSYSRSQSQSLSHSQSQSSKQSQKLTKLPEANLISSSISAIPIMLHNTVSQDILTATPLSSNKHKQKQKLRHQHNSVCSQESENMNYKDISLENLDFLATSSEIIPIIPPPPAIPTSKEDTMVKKIRKKVSQKLIKK